jgi:hypothetical protein
VPIDQRGPGSGVPHAIYQLAEAGACRRHRLVATDVGAMDHIRDQEMPAVGKATHAVVQEAVNAGVWVFGGGLESQRASVVATDGTFTDGPYPETKEVIGGFSLVDLPSREEALVWLPNSPSPAAVRGPRRRMGRQAHRPSGPVVLTEGQAGHRPQETPRIRARSCGSPTSTGTGSPVLPPAPEPGSSLTRNCGTAAGPPR